MERVFNFAPGPSMLPLPVLEQIQKELLCYGSTGMSVMEMSHRSKMYLDIFNQTVADLREVMAIPDHYKVIFPQGGVAALEARNIEKAKLLYDYLDESKLFTGTAQKRDRSRMNVTFVTGDAELDAKFVKEAAAQGLVNLKGHRIVGGMRASIYNAMPIEGVQKLVDFMKQFETEN